MQKNVILTLIYPVPEIFLSTERYGVLCEQDFLESWFETNVYWLKRWVALPLAQLLEEPFLSSFLLEITVSNADFTSPYTSKQ